MARRRSKTRKTRRQTRNTPRASSTRRVRLDHIDRRVTPTRLQPKKSPINKRTKIKIGKVRKTINAKSYFGDSVHKVIRKDENLIKNYICAKRNIRRKVLFALNKKGKGGKKKTGKLEDYVKC